MTRRHPLYGIWGQMLQRCTNPRVKSFKDYGGRGITVCDRWRSFDLFVADMGSRPAGHQIDRKDNNGPYSPDNCRWVPQAVNASNKRNAHQITAGGETLHLAEWARRLGCRPGAILARIKSGMSPEAAVITPIPERPNSKLRTEEALLIRALRPEKSARWLAGEFGVSPRTITNIWHGRTFADVAGASA